jgi:hypothetical protein
VKAQSHSISSMTDSENRAPAAAITNTLQFGDMVPREALPGQGLHRQAALPAPVRGWLEMLQGTSTTGSKVRARRLHPVGRAGQELDGLSPPTAGFFRGHTGNQALAGKGLWDEDRPPVVRGDSVTLAAKGPDLQR